MMFQRFDHGISAVNHQRRVIYAPKQRPGFVAWVTVFDHGDNRIGISFKETIRKHNPMYKPPRLEMGEAVGAPVSYCSIECGSENEISYRVYMVSDDGGETFRETGRCFLEDGSFCNIGFPDGSIIGLDVPRINEERTGWCEGIRVRRSFDGGNTWTDLDSLLPGTSPYLWRIRRLSDGTLIIMASLYGTPWGIGKERATRNTILPSETYIGKIQTFFLSTTDGIAFSGPHYILPGVGAHEYDMVEMEDGALLFIAGDVQGTPVARQIVIRENDRFINGTLTGIHRGSPTDPMLNPQGGFVPETLVKGDHGIIIGARRNRPYACSSDAGENWYEMDGLPASLYQPVMVKSASGAILNIGHFGGDNAFGEVDMYIGADMFDFVGAPPAPCKLQLCRVLSPDGSHYLNKYRSRLSSQGHPLEGEAIVFRSNPVWNDNGSINTTTQSDAPIQIEALTDKDGWATVHFAHLDCIPDIHHYTNVDAQYAGNAKRGLSSCKGPMMCTASLTPHRKNLYPHNAYFANGVLFLAPKLMEIYPSVDKLLIDNTFPDGTINTTTLPTTLVNRLLASNVLVQSKDGQVNWYRSIHSPRPLVAVRMIVAGDWYV